ncbi:MAG: hypothetical protein AAF297_05040 [Planctomycetota bacterium]
MTDRPPGPALSDRLRAEAERDRTELFAALGQGRATYAALAELGQQTIATLTRLGFSDDDAEPIRADDRVLRSAARLLDDPAAAEAPPSNAEVYAAAVNVSEWASIIKALPTAGPAFRSAVAAALDTSAHTQPETELFAEELRLALAFAAVTRKRQPRQLDPKPRHAEPVVDLSIARWPVVCPCVVPGGPADPWPTRARERTLAYARPTIIVLEAGPLLPPSGMPRVADDTAASEIARDRVDRCLVEHRDEWADTLGDDLAFALAARATVPVINAASGRVLFVQVWRCINLCSLDDPRADKLRRFADVLSAADTG